jgi:hypothetical protein
VLLVRSINVVREINQELGKTPFGGCIVPKDRRERSIAKGLRKALTESFAGSGVITQAGDVSDTLKMKANRRNTEESTAQRA